MRSGTWASSASIAGLANLSLSCCRYLALRNSFAAAISLILPTVAPSQIDPGTPPVERKVRNQLPPSSERAVASALRRARVNMSQREHNLESNSDSEEVAPSNLTEGAKRMLERYVKATELLLEDATFSMPPVPTFCFDTGHALVAGPGVASEFLEVMANRLVILHLSDNAGDRDSHLAPGRGLVDWPALFRAIAVADFRGSICIDTPPFAAGPPYASSNWRALLADTMAVAQSAIDESS